MKETIVKLFLSTKYPPMLYKVIYMENATALKYSENLTQEKEVLFGRRKTSYEW
jgi:hypothetical protein